MIFPLMRMRKKWIVGIVIGLFFLYVSYFGVAGIGLTLFPSRTTNLQAGMAWATSETDGTFTFTYTVTSVVGSVVSVHQVGGSNDGIYHTDRQLSFDVTNTTTSLAGPIVVGSELGVGDEVFEVIDPTIGTIHAYVDAIEASLGKNLLIVHWGFTVGPLSYQSTMKYYQDSGVEYSATLEGYGLTRTMYLCISGDPVTGILPNYTISASAGIGGSINPSGAVIVNVGASQTFAITSDSGYDISSVLVDGDSVGNVSSYTFMNVQSSHTISASFSPSQGTIAQVHLNAIFNGIPVTATLNIHFPDGHDESKTTPYDNLDAPVGIYSVSAVYQDKVISSYQIDLALGQNFAHTFDFGAGTTVNYFLLIIRALLGNSQLMQLVGIAITVPSAIMFFWPKPKSQYHE